jgi:hypothetical protein
MMRIVTVPLPGNRRQCDVYVERDRGRFQHRCGRAYSSSRRRPGSRATRTCFPAALDPGLRRGDDENGH